MSVPSNFVFSADGNLVVFLDNVPQTGVCFLSSFNLKTGQRRDLLHPDKVGAGDTEENLSLEEKLRRERTRTQITGITSFQWNGTGLIFVPLQGSLFALDPYAEQITLVCIVEKKSGEPPLLTFTVNQEQDTVGFVQSGSLFAMYVEDGAFLPPTVVSVLHATSTITSGLASYLAQEELDRSEGFWFSPNGLYVAYEVVDESRVAQVFVGRDCFRYPRPGQENPTCSLVVANTRTKEQFIVPLDMKEEEEVYIARVDWYSNRVLLVQLVNRLQTRLELRAYSSETKWTLFTTLLVEERPSAWINLVSEANLKKVPFAREEEIAFLWLSERQEPLGLNQLFLYNNEFPSGKLLSDEKFVVESIVFVDSDFVYVLGNASHVTERNLCRISLNTQQEMRLLTETGTVHHAVFSPQGDVVILTQSSCSFPTVVTLEHVSSFAPTHHEEGKRLRRGAQNDNDEEDDIVKYAPFHNLTTSSLVLSSPFPLSNLPRVISSPPELLSFFPDGANKGFRVYCHVYMPDETKFQKPFPVVVYVYGGPHVQRVRNEWSSSLDIRAQTLRDEGYLVIKCDNRGSFRRGLRFEAGLKHAMGKIELEDQLKAVDRLVEMGFADPKRVGIVGWSYGGYLSALALAKYPSRFAVAIAGAPVTHWSLYDTAYTERYMGLPDSHPHAYEESSVMYFVDKDVPLGRLLLIHGLLDENVHFTHTSWLIDKLIRCEKHFDLLVLPEERHGPRKPENRRYVEQRIVAYFKEHL